MSPFSQINSVLLLAGAVLWVGCASRGTHSGVPSTRLADVSGMLAGRESAAALADRTPAAEARLGRASYFRPMSGSSSGGWPVSSTLPTLAVPRTKLSVAERCSTLSGDWATIGMAKSPSGRRKW